MEKRVRLKWRAVKRKSHQLNHQKSKNHRKKAKKVKKEKKKKERKGKKNKRKRLKKRFQSQRKGKNSFTIHSLSLIM